MAASYFGRFKPLICSQIWVLISREENYEPEQIETIVRVQVRYLALFFGRFDFLKLQENIPVRNKSAVFGI